MSLETLLRFLGIGEDSIVPQDKGIESGFSEEDQGQDFDPKPGRIYVTIGGSEKEIEANCSNCSGPFSGLLQSRCDYCGTGREVYYREITQVNPKKEGGILKESSILLGEGSSVELGRNASVDRVIADRLIAASGLQADLLVIREIEVGNDSYIEHLMLTEGGSAKFGNDCHIETLVVDRQVPIILGYDCQIDELLTVGSPQMRTGDNFHNDSAENISRGDFFRRIKEEFSS